MTKKHSLYKPLSEYGIIGNCRSCALVGSDGSIDWACLPDFDSPSQFCAILDNQKGGFFKIAPEGFFKTHQNYLENTNVLETNFFNQAGNVTISDFMPISKSESHSDQIPQFGTKFVRLVKAVQGDHHFTATLKITPNFAEEKIKITDKENEIIITDQNYQYILHKKHHQTEIKDNIITVKFHLKQGEQEFFSLDFYPKDQKIAHKSKGETNAYLAKLYFQTITYWQWWASLCTYKGDYYTEVLRSALTLKLLTFAPTGAIVAAPTTSLPEKLGGDLNWDYRFTWLRDASFTVYAFLGLGYIKEAERFIQWLENVCIKEGAILKIMYSIRGEEELTEKTLPHLSGYQDSKPVRIGNGAANQKQFDVFGEVLTAISMYVNAGGGISDPVKTFVKQLVDYCCLHWKEKDAGIWEARLGERHNTYSKIMCWAGVDRGLSIAEKIHIPEADIAYWHKTKDQIKADILENGYDKELKTFVLHYDSKALDSSTLNIPIVGLLPVKDPRMLSTIDAVMKNLVVDWFVLRTHDTENKLQEGEGTFFLSTFWLIDCLSLLGRTKEAKLWLDKIIKDATPLGLYAEELDPITRQHLGNFPQAFTHLGLINSVLNLRQAEVFGSEKRSTVKPDRLGKVIKSLFVTNPIDTKHPFFLKFFKNSL